ncbi:hypothetical protein [Candidatus Darwinibacter acetoxidans]|jgi:hypothetical protein
MRRILKYPHLSHREVFGERVSLRWKMLLLVFVVIMLPVLVLGINEYRQTRDMITDMLRVTAGKPCPTDSPLPMDSSSRWKRRWSCSAATLMYWPS